MFVLFFCESKKTAAKQLVTEVGCKSSVVRIGFADDLLLHTTYVRLGFGLWCETLLCISRFEGILVFLC